ncbi:hypothetical protein [Aureimonas sp. AU4]|uniref:hypothetical protein n=1 Tax=Aureimonas sp. AU4 TaxID=1638163 RepID=UPI0012E3EA43|nr:hypothetical protein [Aureimonas sp. AU4]
MTHSATTAKQTANPRPLSAYTDKELSTLVANYRRKGATADPRYSNIVAELHRRGAGNLDLAITIRFLHRAASDGRYVSYGQVAEANGRDWNDVRYPMNTHLWALVDFARRAGWPMLSALIVNKANVETGSMDDGTKKGFATAARSLGHIVQDEQAFLDAQQAACRAWGATALDESLLPTSRT